jgi:cytochrome c-type biogenesis protein CcmH
MSRRVVWVVLALAVGVALVVGARGDGEPSADDRLSSIAKEVRCPKCAGQSIASSDAPAARAIREQIRADIAAGRDDDTIRARLTASYGEEILLNPPRSGFAGLVWIVPVAVVVIAFGGLALAFRRWDRPSAPGPSRRDRELVAAALGQDPDDPHGEGSGR